MTAAVEKTVREKPILFSGPMVRAILEGRKSMTRRVVKPQPGNIRKSPFVPSGLEDEHGREIRPRYYPGDMLWVRETFGWDKDGPHTGPLKYRATYAGEDNELLWKPSIFMPRWASRITLEITNIRVERIDQITIEDIEAEGTPVGIAKSMWSDGFARVQDFKVLWNSINEKRGFGWDSQCWVWVVEFRKVEQK